ncbi:MAG TPA: hypothetical protein VKC54_01800 [Patescibacteria group bacterium]|nr:hypothetical protein [Patescibacteria group bacterium]
MSLAESGSGQSKDPRKIFNFFVNMGEKIVKFTLGPSDEELQTIVGGANPKELRLFLTKSRDLKLRVMATEELVRRLNNGEKNEASSNPPQPPQV